MLSETAVAAWTADSVEEDSIPLVLESELEKRPVVQLPNMAIHRSKHE